MTFVNSKESSDLTFQDLLHVEVFDGEQLNKTAIEEDDVSPPKKSRRSSSPISSRSLLSQIPFVGPGEMFVNRREKIQKNRGRGKGRGKASNVSSNEERIPTHLTRESRLARRKDRSAKQP